MSRPPLNQLGEFLENRAKRCEPIFYNELAMIFGLPPVTEAWSSHPLCELFDTLDVADQQAGSPFRTALVVGKQTSIPGDGFFKTLNRLRNTPYPIRDELKKMEIWKGEFDRLIDFYASHSQA